MASFCGNCGSPLRPDSTFCVQCGSPVSQPPNPVPASSFQPAAAPVAPRKSSAALKIVVALLVCLVLGGVAVVGGLFYVAHRVKKAVVEEAAKNGVDLSSLSGSSRRVSGARHPLPKPCELLAKEEVSRLIGEPVERAEFRDETCLYYGPPGLAAKLAQTQASETFHRAGAPDQLVNSLAAQTG